MSNMMNKAQGFGLSLITKIAGSEILDQLKLRKFVVLPPQATLLASSELYPNQAFAVGSQILALQFHLEVLSNSLEKWLIGHTAELTQAKINIPALRQENIAHAPQLEVIASRIFSQWLQALNPNT